MELRTLASGSSGNCILVSHNGAHLLVDAGISCRRIVAALRSLAIEPEHLLGVCITHEHSDHIAGLATLTKHYALPVYTSPGTARQLCYRMAGLEELVRPLTPGEAGEAGGFELEGFAISHDASEPMGFAFSAGGKKAAVVTDLGYVSDEVLDSVVGADLVVCEANHDVEWLQSGPYPYYLKARILGDKGHLSNEAGAAPMRAGGGPHRSAGPPVGGEQHPGPGAGHGGKDPLFRRGGSGAGHQVGRGSPGGVVPLL